MSYLIPYFACLLLLLLTCVIHLMFKRKQTNVKRWQKLLNLQKHEKIFYQLYEAGDNGFLLSQRARRKKNAIEYAYGEIEFISFIALLSLVKPDENTVFYDLGSGIGKAVIACSMVFPVHKSVGIEIFPELYLNACKIAEQLTSIKNYCGNTHKIQFIQGDFLESDLTEATLIFINATAFFGPLWEKLSEKINNLPHLQTVITTSKILESSHFHVTTRTKVEMSWGVVFAYIHTRKQHATNRLENIE